MSKETSAVPAGYPPDRAGRVARASLILMVASIGSRLLGLVREQVISYQFGTSRDLDAYRAAFNVPDLIFQIVAAGAMGAAFIPVFTKYLTRGHERRAWQMASTVLNTTFLALAVASGLAALFAPQIVPLLTPGFEPQARALTVTLMRLMLIAPLLTGLSGLAAAILQSYNDFLLPALSPVVYNLAIIAGGVFLAPRLGVLGLAMGVVAGAALHLLVQMPGLWRRNAGYRLQIDAQHEGAREVGRLMLPRIAGLGAIQVNYLANTVVASGLAAGSIAALNYAFQLLMLPWGIVAGSIATAVFPTLSEDAALENKAQVRRTMSAAVRVILYLSLPAGVGLFVLREPLIQLLFQRGQFTAASTAMTASALTFYAPSLFAIAATEILTRGFYALHDTRTPVKVSVATVALNILLSVLLSRPLGVGGLALAYLIANSLETLLLLAIMRGRLAGLDEAGLLRSVGRSAVAALVMGEGLALGLYACGPLLSGGILLVRLLLVALLVLIGAGIYFALTIWLGSDEMAAIARRFRRR